MCPGLTLPEMKHHTLDLQRESVVNTPNPSRRHAVAELINFELWKGEMIILATQNPPNASSYEETESV